VRVIIVRRTRVEAMGRSWTDGRQPLTNRVTSELPVTARTTATHGIDRQRNSSDESSVPATVQQRSTGPRVIQASLVGGPNAMDEDVTQQPSTGSGNQKKTGSQSGSNPTKSTSQSKDKSGDGTTSVNPSVNCPAPTATGQQSPCTISATINNENLYHWDVSFAVPFRTVTDLQYTQPSGNGDTVVPKTVTRLNAYA
jgi:hypothetical protein